MGEARAAPTAGPVISRLRRAIDMKRIDLVGHRFGRLVVESDAPAKTFLCGRRSLMWTCRCDCGEVVTVMGESLRCGDTQSCGCLKRDRSTTHGHAKDGRVSPEYRTWQDMLQRCLNPRDTGFNGYGGRGITVCDRWNPSDGGSFENFLGDLGERPGKRYSLDRIDNDQGYEPDNCRWADPKTQARNTRLTVFVTYKGQRMPRAQAVELSGLSTSTVLKRVRLGWPESEWFRPVRKSRAAAESS
jgi:hypothetical protein